MTAYMVEVVETNRFLIRVDALDEEAMALAKARFEADPDRFWTAVEREFWFV